MSVRLKLTYLYLFFILLYAGGALLLPAAPETLQKYHISLTNMRLLSLTIIILYAVIWFCAFYGFYHLYNYSQLIKKNKDGKPVQQITIGIGFLALWFPITSTVNTYTAYLIQKHANLVSPINIFQNYLSLLLPLMGFIFISLGSRKLSEIAKKRPSVRGTNVMAVFLIVIGTFYVHLVSNTQNRLNSTYHMPIQLILLTFVVPYIFMWFLGVLSFYEIYIYKRKVAGIIYRKCWTLLAFGLGSLIVVSIGIQYLTTISQRLNKLSLNNVLLIVYTLLIFLGFSYVLIALGVKNLKKIEEV